MELFNEWLPKVVESSTTLTPRHTDHGVGHWKRVAANAMKLAAETRHVDLTVVQLFALFHDSMRESEYGDPDHGMRGYKLAVELGAIDSLSQNQVNLFRTATVFHDSGMTNLDTTIGVCWDADRLDLPRVGIAPDPEFFSTEAGKKAAEKTRTIVGDE